MLVNALGYLDASGGTAIGGLLVVIVLILAVITPVFSILVAVDAARLPDAAFERARTSKTLWIVLPLVGLATCGLVSLVAVVMWYGSVRGRVRAAIAALPPPGDMAFGGVASAEPPPEIPPPGPAAP